MTRAGFSMRMALAALAIVAGLAGDAAAEIFHNAVPIGAGGAQSSNYLLVQPGSFLLINNSGSRLLIQ